MLFTMQEIQAMLALLNRLPMSPAEMLFANGFFQRLATFCTPPPAPVKEPEPKGPELTEDQAQAMADALAIADALDALDEEEAQDADPD